VDMDSERFDSIYRTAQATFREHKNEP
jgi:hypothetical protein